MKFTSKILLALLVVLIGAVLSSNIILKNEYDKVDKSDIYWNYKNVLQQPFKYLVIKGGNTTRIAFEQSSKYSVRILQEWQRYHNGEIKTYVSHDTLYINFDFKPAAGYETFWMQDATTVRIFSPELLVVNGFNTNFEMFKLKQKNISVNMSGKTKFEVESLIPNLDTLYISQRDSAVVVFEMSPDYKKSQTFHVKYVAADVKGVSVLDLGHGQIDSLQINIADSSGILLSGGTLKKKHK